MKSSVATPLAYLESISPDRRQALQIVRRVILDSIDARIQECMQYGVVGYCVPHSVWEYGHHTNPTLPLMYMGLSSQKNDMVVYMLFLLHDPQEREWFARAWKQAGKKVPLQVGGMGCCVRFKKLDDLALDVIAESIRRTSLKKYLENHVGMLARIGKAADGTPLGNGSRGADRQKTSARQRANASSSSTTAVSGEAAPAKKRSPSKSRAGVSEPPSKTAAPKRTTARHPR